MNTNTGKYVWSILTALAVGGLSALLTSGNMDVYQSIVKPPLAPPGFLFPIVWSILYALMGFSAARVVIKGREKGVDTAPCIRIYALQLAVNFFWSIIFFNLRAFFFSFVWLLLLWMLIIFMIKCFYKADFVSALVNLPYFIWVTFAAYLNYMIYVLN